jgi:putative transposase
MKKAFRFRIYPTKKQETTLEQTLALCAELYNAGLQERRDAYRMAKVSVSYKDQANQLPEIKEVRADLGNIYSQILQDVLKRLDKAMDDFFRRIKTGETPGFPRFRSRARYDSFTYPQASNGSAKIVNDKLHLSGIGHIKIKLHRALEGKVKTYTIRRTATGKWFACFSCEVEARPLTATNESTGVDAGLKSLLTLSSGEEIAAPKFFRQEEKALAKEQRKLSALPKGSRERKKQCQRVARVHERITNKRTNYAHLVSHWLVMLYGIIIFESLAIKNMVKNHCLAKSITDAAWNQIVMFTTYKAENTGRQVIMVNPAYTSQSCSACGKRQAMPLSERVYNCICGLKIDRDHNAALNILALGLQSVGLRPIEAASL